MKLGPDVADYCPVHGIPMWWWPTGGTWACQLSDCDATQPVRWAETESVRHVRRTWLAGDRYAAMVTPPKSIFHMGSYGS